MSETAYVVMDRRGHGRGATISAIHISQSCCGESSEKRTIIQFPLKRIEHNPILIELGFCVRCCPELEHRRWTFGMKPRDYAPNGKGIESEATL